MITLGEIKNVEVAALADEAAKFLAGQRWCERIGTGWLSFAIPGVLGIFLFQVVGKTKNVPSEVWVVVGDLPSAYIVQSADAGWQICFQRDRPTHAIVQHAPEHGAWVPTETATSIARPALP